jgi:hypothetical protein
MRAFVTPACCATDVFLKSSLRLIIVSRLTPPLPPQHSINNLPAFISNARRALVQVITPSGFQRRIMKPPSALHYEISRALSSWTRVSCTRWDRAAASQMPVTAAAPEACAIDLHPPGLISNARRRHQQRSAPPTTCTSLTPRQSQVK